MTKIIVNKSYVNKVHDNCVRYISESKKQEVTYILNYKFLLKLHPSRT